MKIVAILDKALEFTFGFGAVWFMAFITLSAIIPTVPFLWGLPSVFMMVIPKAIWVWKLRPDPFDNITK